MGIKKIARPMNKAKNAFLKWLKDNGADNIDVYNGAEDSSTDHNYYVGVSAFIGNDYYSVYFMVWRTKELIDYRGGDYRYEEICIDEFEGLII